VTLTVTDDDGATDTVTTTAIIGSISDSTPPVNQMIGTPDVAQGLLVEADCRACHFSGVPDRHHALYGTERGGVTPPYPDPGGSTTWTCINCHSESFTVERDCVVCHTANAHHSAPDALARNCVACHGDIVDNFDDGHYIPTYNPSLVTPGRSGGTGLPDNGRGTLAGGCDYCHDDDGLPTPVILTNQDLHHNTGLSDCNWCHDFALPFEEQIRVCEQCHGPDSLHNIQADSPAAANVGTLVVGGEDAGYGHVGRDAGPGDSDCWGCHGFVIAMAGAPVPGPVIPSIDGSNISLTTAGTDTPVVVTGAGFTNMGGDVLFESNVLLTGVDGSTVTLTPDTILQDRLTVTIPGSTAPGNYNLQAVKAQFASNPAVISIVPEVIITDAAADGTTVAINGSGFGGYAAGSGTSVMVTGTTVEGTIVVWSDTRIVAEFASSPSEVTVNSVYGTDTSEVAGSGNSTFLRGDSNADGEVDISDAVHTLGFLFLGTPAPSCPDASDSDDNALLEITDAVLTLNWLFLGQGDLASPGPEACGSDPTEDALPACDYDPTKC
jgi:hypothetical protein